MRLVRRGRKSFSEPPFWSDLSRWGSGSAFSIDREVIDSNFEGYIQGAYKANGVVFATCLVRQLAFSEARFLWRSFQNGRPGKLFGTPDLALLENPWPNGTTGELLARMEQDASLAGNSYWTTADDLGRFGAAATGPGFRMVRMRPDWVTIVIGSFSGNPYDLDARPLGYLYRPQGPGSDSEVLLLPSEVAHYSPVPDPSARFRGMSWLTPVLEEITADKAGSKHKRKLFENGARPAMVVSFDKAVSPDNFQKFKAMLDSEHKGPANAFKTLYLGAGADAKPMTFDFQALDLRSVLGQGETRIAAAGRVPPMLVGLSEGLDASTLANFAQARRLLADMTMRPLWRMAAASLQTLLTPPAGASLWYDDRDISFLREDRKDVAEIQWRKASTIRNLVDAGYTPESVIAAVEAEDYSLLVHSGLYSVQLQPAGATNTGTTNKPPVEED